MAGESIDLVTALEMVEDPIIWKNKGDEFFNNANFEDAIKCYTYATELKPDFIDAWSAMALASQPDPSGKFASIAIQTDKGTFPVLKNAIASKMEPYAGSRAELEAMPKEVDGKKV